MESIDSILAGFELNRPAILRYRQLNRKIHGSGATKSLFTIMDSNDPEHNELNLLSGKIIKLNAYLLTNRHTANAQHLVNILYG